LLEEIDRMPVSDAANAVCDPSRRVTQRQLGQGAESSRANVRAFGKSPFGGEMPNRNKPIEVRPATGEDAGWEVARQGESTVISKHRTQGAAIKKGKPLARRDQTEFVLKGRNGRVRDRSSCGNDPRGRG
jgi:Uncharacterized protein conserved in bacteria (DUF2188)